MSSTYEIPLSPQPQKFQIVIAGVTYGLRVYWSAAAQAWVLDIQDVNGTTLLNGVALVTGADLLEQYAYLQFGFGLFVGNDDSLFGVPTFQSLGLNSHLIAVVP